MTYTLNFTNIGDHPAVGVVIKDLIPLGTTFVSGSIISTAPYTGSSLEVGITLTSPILPGQSVTISFKVLVTSNVFN